MPTVFGVHELELKPGVNPQELEQVVGEADFPALRLPDSALYLLKGDRGKRNGPYLPVDTQPPPKPATIEPLARS